MDNIKNKKAVFIGGAVVLIVIIALALYLSGKNKKGDVSLESQSEKQTTQEKFLSLKEIASQNTPQKCSVEFSDGVNKSETQLWIKGDKFKQITVIETPEQGKREAVIISNGTYMYSWDEATKKGNKIKLDETYDLQSEESRGSANLDWDTEFNYNCSAAVISDAELTPPNDVDFVDLEAELEKMQESLEGFDVDSYMQDIPSVQE